MIEQDNFKKIDIRAQTDIHAAVQIILRDRDV